MVTPDTIFLIPDGDWNQGENDFSWDTKPARKPTENPADAIRYERSYRLQHLEQKVDTLTAINIENLKGLRERNAIIKKLQAGLTVAADLDWISDD